MLISSWLIDALEIIRRVPSVFIAGMIILVAASEPWQRWVDHAPTTRWEKQTGIGREFAAVPAETLAGVAAVIAGMGTYFGLAFLIIASTVISTTMLGAVPAYEGLLYFAAAFALCVGFAVQHVASLRLREFFAWG